MCTNEDQRSPVVPSSMARQEASACADDRASARSRDGTRGLSGFTLIELLVVVAVISLLVALLLPAVQQAREAARRTQCKNNLKQMGIAFHSYHEIFNCFPKGGYGGSLASSVLYETANAKACRVVSWGIALLPHLDQSNLYQQWDFNQWYLQPSNQKLAQTMLPVFLCPSVNLPLLRANGDAVNSLPQYARSDYSGNWGERGVRCYPSTNCQNNYSSLGDSSGNSRGTMMLQPNASFLSLTLGLRDMVDGTGYTTLVGEAPNAIFGTWASHKNVMDQSAGLNLSFARTSTWSSCVVTATQMTSTNGALGLLGCDVGHQDFHSYHTGGAHFLFCDGSVRFVSQSMNNVVFSAIFSYKGGELISEGF